MVFSLPTSIYIMYATGQVFLVSRIIYRCDLFDVLWIKFGYIHEHFVHFCHPVGPLINSEQNYPNR